jgi:hypothetical protein
LGAVSIRETKQELRRYIRYLGGDTRGGIIGQGPSLALVYSLISWDLPGSRAYERRLWVIRPPRTIKCNNNNYTGTCERYG